MGGFWGIWTKQGQLFLIFHLNKDFNTSSAADIIWYLSNNSRRVYSS